MENIDDIEKGKFMEDLTDIKEKLNKHDVDISEIKTNLAINNKITQDNSESTKELSKTLKEVSITMCKINANIEHINRDNGETKSNIQNLQKEIKEIREKSQLDIMAWIKSNFVSIVVVVTLGYMYIKSIF